MKKKIVPIKNKRKHFFKLEVITVLLFDPLRLLIFTERYTLFLFTLIDRGVWRISHLVLLGIFLTLKSLGLESQV